MTNYTLSIEPEEGEARSVPLLEELTVIGRSESAEIRVEEPRASREHLEVRIVSGGVAIRDLDSTNGTFIDDRRILQSRLLPGESFRIGRTSFTLTVLASSPVRPPRRQPVWGTLVAVLGPALVLFILAEFGLGEFTRSRERLRRESLLRIDRSDRRLEAVAFRRAEGRPEEERSDALREFLRAYPDSEHRARAEEVIRNLLTRETDAERVEREIVRLREEWRREQLTFSEYYDSLEMLLKMQGRIPGAEERIRAELGELRKTHHEELSRMVAAERTRVEELAERGMFGRALAVLTTFADHYPEAAAAFSEEIRAAERAVLSRGEEAYQKVVETAASLAGEGRKKEATELLIREEPRFSGTHFGTLLLLRGDLYSVRREGGAPLPTRDQLELRRSYHLLALEAEELAAGGLFAEAADKYASMLESIAIPAVRAEFERRNLELRGLTALLLGLKKEIAERGSKFGSVKLGERRYSVRGLTGGEIILRGPGGEIKRRWPDLDPGEILALLRRARSPSADRLAIAVYCVELNLREEFEREILAALGKEDLRERAGRLYAQKQGAPYPEGGYVAYKGRILTGPEHAEEIHREKIAKLRDRQVGAHRRIEAHPVFKRLAKIREVRLRLDKARTHALTLIFDEQKYFYPYRDRMKEYTPVMREVNARVTAVRQVWDDPARVVLKVDASLRSLLKDAEEAAAELKALGIDNREFDRAFEDLTIYLGRTLTVRSYFHDRVELLLLEYNRRAMAANEEMETVATDPERRQVEITNEYRMMMGRRVLLIDDRLVKSSRGHSEEMVREGYFGHFSPYPERRTPQQRMKLEGYKGSGMSENCHRGSGSPQGAHDGWLNSSGHHRNILHKYWTEMGTGHSGRTWTQNFGRTRPRIFPEKDDAADEGD